MSNLEKYQQLAEKQKREKAKIEGRLEALYESLAEEGHTSLSSAKKEVTSLGKKIVRQQKMFDSKLAQFEKTYAEEIS